MSLRNKEYHKTSWTQLEQVLHAPKGVWKYDPGAMVPWRFLPPGDIIGAAYVTPGAYASSRDALRADSDASSRHCHATLRATQLAAGTTRLNHLHKLPQLLLDRIANMEDGNRRGYHRGLLWDDSGPDEARGWSKNTASSVLHDHVTLRLGAGQRISQMHVSRNQLACCSPGYLFFHVAAILFNVTQAY